MSDEPQDIEEQRRELYVAERDARDAYAREAPTGTTPRTGPTPGGPWALGLKKLQDKVRTAIAARKTFDKEHIVHKRSPYP